jgi:hypothetical protein
MSQMGHLRQSMSVSPTDDLPPNAKSQRLTCNHRQLDPNFRTNLSGGGTAEECQCTRSAVDCAGQNVLVLVLGSLQFGQPASMLWAC